MQELIMLVDDDPTAIKTMSRMLAGFGKIQFACSGEEAMRLVREVPPTLILMDSEMPGMNGFQLCNLLKADPALVNIPVIFVTSHNDVQFEVTGFQIGAVDVIAKPVSSPLLQARVRTQLRIKHLTDELRRTSMTDGLTRVGNRRSLDEALDREWIRSRRNASPLSVLMVDVDHFKLFNDRYGHIAGDECLQRIAGALKDACLRPADMVARYGGEEFVMLLPDTSHEGAKHVAARVLDAVAKLAVAHDASPASGHVTVSVGLTCYDKTSQGWVTSPGESRHTDDPPSVLNSAKLLQAADKALYAAKLAGRAQAWMLDPSSADFPDQARNIAPLNCAADVGGAA